VQEYYGDNVKNYRQPPDKYVRLFPAIERVIKKFNLSSTKVLDLGCGDGILYSLFFENNGFDYTGIDISPDMIQQAKEKNPKGNFIVGSGANFSKDITSNYDFVISNMLFPSISDFTVFNNIFMEVSKVLKPGGYFIATIMNPCFDGYMQKMLFDRKDIETNFTGYYTSPSKYAVNREIDGVKFTFTDYHWKFSDYLNASNSSNLQFIHIDECIPIGDAKDIGGPTMEKMLKIPNFLILVFKKMI